MNDEKIVMILYVKRVFKKFRVIREEWIYTENNSKLLEVDTVVEFSVPEKANDVYKMLNNNISTVLFDKHEDLLNEKTIYRFNKINGIDYDKNL